MAHQTPPRGAWLFTLALIATLLLTSLGPLSATPTLPAAVVEAVLPADPP